MATREVEISWPGGTHLFRLGLGNLRAIQEHCDAGPHQINMRLEMGTWRVDDLFEVLRQGLIGGGMPTKDASRLVTSLIERHPLQEFVLPARGVLVASLIGVEDDMPGELEGEIQPPPESGSSARSTEEDAPSD